MNDALSMLFERCGIAPAQRCGGALVVHSPIDGAELACVHETPLAAMPELIARAKAAFQQWREVPAPVRGELVRLWGEELRRAKADIGRIVSLEEARSRRRGWARCRRASTSASSRWACRASSMAAPSCRSGLAIA